MGLEPRWVPCQHCLQRVKLCTINGDENLVIWMHSPSDEEEFYKDCDPDDILAMNINRQTVAYPFLTG